MAKETKYFQHDYNARNNIRIRRLRKVYGATGYGLYWYLAEMMHEDERNGIDIDQDVIEFLSEDNGISTEQVISFLDDCVVKFKLFLEDQGFYTAERVTENKDYREQVRQTRVEAGKKGAAARWQNGKPMANAIDSMANANSKIANDGILKEKKGNKSKEERILLIQQKQKSFYALLVDHVEKYGREMIRAFYDHWCQPNKSLTQIGWELQKTWDLEARLRNWEANQIRFGSNRAGQKHLPSQPQASGLKSAAEILREREEKRKAS